MADWTKESSVTVANQRNAKINAVMLPPANSNLGPSVLREAAALTVRSESLEHHAEGLSTLVIFLNTVMARLSSVPVTTMSWTACPVKTVKLLRTAMRANARHPATKAADICFRAINLKGNVFGNCGIGSNGKLIPCSLADSMCGKLQCVNVDFGSLPNGAQISATDIEGERCINADFNLGPDVLDPGYVNSGSPCEEGKACLDFKCVNASALLPNLDCDAQSTCNGRGVCNDQGNCHCGNGWAPPNCDKSGRGGSVNSGPAQIDHSLRDGLLIFFLLVVPLLVLLILVLLYFFRRDSLDPCLKGRRLKSRNVTNGNANGNSSATTQPLSRATSDEVHCYYHGEVEGYEDSLVALSTCSGLRGVILLGNETYGLEPVPQSPTNEHLLYLLKDNDSGPVTCGVVSEASPTQSHEPFEPGKSLTSLLRVRMLPTFT
ncbi:uncharacterized protein PEZ65_020977 [Lycodopsis pacificus]